MVEKKKVAIVVLCTVTVLLLVLFVGADQEVRTLEEKLWELEASFDDLKEDYVSLELEIARLKTEIENAVPVDYAALEQQINELKSQVKSLEDEIEQARTEEEEPEPTITYVGSKNSDVYHYTWCHYVDRIKAENKRYFSSSQAARSAGYRPCLVCKPP